SKLPSGTAVTAQVAGDCKVIQCDGGGNQVQVTDDSDRPVDGNACTADVCTAGVPSNPPLPPDTSCGGPAVCDRARHCFGCVPAGDCPGQDSACQARTCGADFTCGVSNVPDGTALGAQTAGDCRTAACDGNGNVKSVADDSDLPDDGNPCTIDACTQG